MRARLPLLALAALGLAVPATPATAGEAGGSSQAPGADRRRDAAPLTLDDAVELVKRRYDARVLRAEETREGDETVYRIRLLDADGRVFSVRVNARTGAVE
jgi:uncharacterized membrane protein YkoI